MSDGRPTVKTATEARQGRTTGVVRWVLGISLTPRSSCSTVTQIAPSRSGRTSVLRGASRSSRASRMRNRAIGVRALALVQEEEEALGRAIRHAIVFTMTRAIKSKQHTAIEASLKGQGVDVIMPPLMERAAFSALFDFGGDLRSMPAQGKMEPASDNAAQFANAVYQRLAGPAK